MGMDEDGINWRRQAARDFDWNATRFTPLLLLPICHDLTRVTTLRIHGLNLHSVGGPHDSYSYLIYIKIIKLITTFFSHWNLIKGYEFTNVTLSRAANLSINSIAIAYLIKRKCILWIAWFSLILFCFYLIQLLRCKL
jgi:hypothetical protein